MICHGAVEQLHASHMSVSKPERPLGGSGSSAGLRALGSLESF